MSGEATSTDEKAAKEFLAMTQKAGMQWIPFSIVTKQVPNACLKRPPSQGQNKNDPGFKATKDLTTLVFSADAQQRTTSQPPTAAVTTFHPVTGKPPSTTSIPNEPQPFQYPLPQANFRSFSRQRAIFIVVFMYFFTS